jgi:hypothetical protein
MGHELTAWDKYGLCVDYALSSMSMSYGIVKASTITEVWYTVVMQVIAAGTYAYVIGGVCESLSNEDPADAKYRTDMDTLNGFFRKHEIPLALRKECHYFMSVYRQKLEDDVYDKALEAFTPRLRRQLGKAMVSHLIQDVCVLKWVGQGEDAYFQVSGLQVSPVQTVF